ncbi:hypothetical protein EJP77_15835 [Paenibacillus zeisoli]|uniref:Uncharacterized protein n=1 Tax=Paenibacillus zeisoli TaxID=2496267 RepID=A0A3S1B483_9BACL|nr:hypothetical protein [Paenibacillus zeisoli]RUT29180.1 hypothetical protein EJP77_15835 [Paenibacillus zeisoli]
MKKIMIIATGWVCLLVLASIVYVAWPWLSLLTGIHSLPNPTRPSIIYGEFPFRLEYELNGTRMVIEDKLICEFDGFGADEGRGKYRKWNQRLASGSKSIILLKLCETKEIEFVPGSAEYYMGDSGSSKNDSSFPNAIIISRDGRFTTESGIRAEQLLKQYNIKLLNWNGSQPITNNFSGE